MEEITAKKASELLKRKGELTDDLSKLCKDSDYSVVLAYETSKINYYCLSSSPWKLKIDSDKQIKDEIRQLLHRRVNDRITKIDEELKNLSC